MPRPLRRPLVRRPNRPLLGLALLAGCVLLTGCNRGNRETISHSDPVIESGPPGPALAPPLRMSKPARSSAPPKASPKLPPPAPPVAPGRPSSRRGAHPRNFRFQDASATGPVANSRPSRGLFARLRDAFTGSPEPEMPVVYEVPAGTQMPEGTEYYYVDEQGRPLSPQEIASLTDHASDPQIRQIQSVIDGQTKDAAGPELYVPDQSVTPVSRSESTDLIEPEPWPFRS